MSRKLAAAFAAGLSFGVGLGVAEMTNPEKVLAFLDVTGAWDPSLAFVMVGAIAVYACAVRVAERRGSPLTGGAFAWPRRTEIDAPLLVGSAIFGVGWGLGGYCPGPALVSAASGAASAMVFVVAMAAGVVAHRITSRS